MSTLFNQVESFFDGLTVAWKTNDGSVVASSFTEDGSLINPFGERADGRSAIAAMYTEYFRGMLGGTSTSFQLTHAHAIESDHAFADCDQAIYDPDGNVVLAVHISALLRREGGSWHFVDSRPYAFAAS